MDRKYRYFISILTGACLLTAPATAGAERSQTTAADYLVEIGLRSLEKGDEADAVHEFSKALILDPDHEGAIKQLKKLGVDEGLYTGTKTLRNQVNEFEEDLQVSRDRNQDLADHNQDLMRKMVRVQDERDDLHRRYLDREKEVETLQKELGSLSRELEITKNRVEPDERRPERIHDFRLSSSDTPKVLFSEAETAKEDQYMSPQPIDAQGAAAALGEGIPQAVEYEKQLASLSRVNNDLKEDMFHLQRNREKLYNILEEYVYIRSETVEALRDQLINKEMDLTNKEHMMLSRLDEISELQGLLSEYVAGMNERDELLEEKNQEIMRLIERLEELQKGIVE